MSANADSWDDTTIGSVARMNHMTIVSGTGSYLAGLDKTLHKLFHCTSTGSGFTKDHVYLCNTDGNGVIDLSVMQAHQHTNSSTDGGIIFEVLRANSATIDSGPHYMYDIHKSEWIESKTGTGTTSEGNAFVYTDEYALQTSTGATSGSDANLREAGPPPDYTHNTYYQAICEFSATSSLAAHIGMGVEDAASADDNNRKVGHVVCTATNGNWFARSANGTTRSDSDMGVAFATSQHNVSAYNDSGVNITYKVDNANTLVKTTDIPTSGTGNRNNIFKIGIKNTTAADRKFWLHKVRWIYETSTLWY